MQIGRRFEQLEVVPAKPFVGPPRHGFGDRFVLWPAGTGFIVKVDRSVPLTIDGKKAEFSQFTVGQTVNLQYIIIVKRNWDGPAYSYCSARRIDAHAYPLKLPEHRGSGPRQ